MRIRTIKRGICGTCDTPINLWCELEGKSIRKLCPECKAEYITGNTIGDYFRVTIIHRVFQEGPMESDISRRRPATWQVEKENGKKGFVYLTCPSCATICKTDLSEVDDGYVGGGSTYGCTTCKYCHLHFWPYLEGWKK